MATLTASLWDEFFAGSRRACARLITRVENDPDNIPEMRDRLSGKLGRAIRIGITGPPGVGKSTLSAMLAQTLANIGHRVGIIAVDPSSPFTGGAFMGDRVRMDRLVGDERIFMRSLASRDGSGGLSPSTPYVADVLEGFGMDRILIETVGVGQAELDVMACADLVILVMQPSTGDAIQSLKAGILEAANIVVVNKADLPGLEMVTQSLRFAFSLSHRPDHPAPPILPTSAQSGEGIEAVCDEIEKQVANLVETGRHQEMVQTRYSNEIREGIQAELWRQVLSTSNLEAEIAAEAARLAANGDSPFPFIRRASANFEVKIVKEAKNHDA